VPDDFASQRQPASRSKVRGSNSNELWYSTLPAKGPGLFNVPGWARVHPAHRHLHPIEYRQRMDGGKNRLARTE
jgi:hypothetical protein